MKKRVVLCLLVIFCFGLLFSEGSAETTVFQEKSHYAVVTDGAMEKKVLSGADLARAKYYPYLQVDVLRINNTFETEALILSAISSGYDSIFSIGGSEEIMKNLSLLYPSVDFVSYSDTLSPSLPSNYTEFYLDLYPTSYLCGVATSFLSFTGKIGVIVDSSYPSSYLEGFLKGLGKEGINTSVDIYYIEKDTPSFTIGAIADSLYSEGADIVFTLIGERAEYVIEKAEGRRGYVIVGDYHHQNKGPVLLSVNIDLEKITSTLIERIKEGVERGKSYSLSIKDGVVDLSWFIDEKEMYSLPREMMDIASQVKSRLRLLRSDIIDGKEY